MTYLKVHYPKETLSCNLARNKNNYYEWNDGTNSLIQEIKLVFDSEINK